MRERIKKMRHLFVQLLKEYGAEQDFSFIMEQNGMFSFSGLSPEQVDRLKEEFAIYAVRSGRIKCGWYHQKRIFVIYAKASLKCFNQ